MRGIPEAVCKLLRLENLALDNNSIELLKPDCFANLTQLRSLTMNNNRLTEIPNHIFDSNKLLQLVNFNVNNINSIGLYVFSNASILKNLESISNRIEYLPGRAYLINVTILDVSNNLISRLDPLALTLLQEASEIRLHNNHITSTVNDILANNSNLKSLTVTGSAMRGIPEAVCKLLRLENLALDNNSIELLKPDCFANLTQLRSLTMNNNRLTEIPNHIFDSNKLLQLVNFNENNINSIGLYVFSNASILKNLESISFR
ncbi:hypothetical protein CAPTEDRAFT_122243, partial [Capitella teleta]